MSARAQATKAAIVAAAGRLMAERGVHGVTVEQIAKEAHVSVGAIYTHFAGKPGLVLHFVVVGLDALEARLLKARKLESPIARVQAAGDAYFRFAVDHPVAARFAAVRVLEPDLSPEFAEVNKVCSERVRGLVVGVAQDLRTAMEEGEIPVSPIDETMIYLWALWSGTNLLMLRRDELAISADVGFRALTFGRSILELTAGLRRP